MNNFIKLLIISLATSTYFSCTAMQIKSKFIDNKGDMASGTALKFDAEFDITLHPGASLIANEKIDLKAGNKIIINQSLLISSEILLQAPFISLKNLSFNSQIYVKGAFVVENVQIKDLIVEDAGNIDNLPIISEFGDFKTKLNAIKEMEIPIILLKGKTEIDSIEFIGDVTGIVLCSKDVVIKDLKNGTTILYPTCNFCAKEGKLLRCGACKLTYYCDQGCQINDWNNHKSKCKK